jgi:hypothetical protein
MAKVWKITAYEEQMGGGPPRKHYYLVAMSDQSAAPILSWSTPWAGTDQFFSCCMNLIVG